MGTLSKRRLEEFGLTLEDRLAHLRRGVGKQLHRVSDRIDVQHTGDALSTGVGRVASILPPVGWLALAGASVLGSIGLRLARHSNTAAFIAACVPTFLMLGLFPRATAPAVDADDVH